MYIRICDSKSLSSFGALPSLIHLSPGEAMNLVTSVLFLSVLAGSIAAQDPDAVRSDVRPTSGAPLLQRDEVQQPAVATPSAAALRQALKRGRDQPIDWNRLHTPWKRCVPSAMLARM